MDDLKQQASYAGSIMGKLSAEAKKKALGDGYAKYMKELGKRPRPGARKNPLDPKWQGR